MFKQKIRKFAFAIILSIFPAITFYSAYDTILNWTYEFDMSSLVRPAGYVAFSIVSYYGWMILIKPLLSSLTLFTKNRFIIQIFTIVTTLAGLLMLLRFLDVYNIDLNYNDQGILLEIIGFFIYLNPINRYLTNILVSEDDEDVEHSTITKTTAIGLVLIGLTMQFSYFSQN